MVVRMGVVVKTVLGSHFGVDEHPFAHFDVQGFLRFAHGSNVKKSW